MILGVLCWHLRPIGGYDCKLNNSVFMRFLREKWSNSWSSIWNKYIFSSRSIARGIGGMPPKFRFLGAVLWNRSPFWCYDCKLRFLREKILNSGSSIWKKKFSSRRIASGFGACPQENLEFCVVYGSIWCHSAAMTFKLNNSVFMRCVLLREKWPNVWSSIWNIFSSTL